MSKGVVTSFTLDFYGSVIKTSPLSINERYERGEHAGFFRLPEARLRLYWKILAPLLEEDRQTYLRSVNCDPEKY